MSSKGCIRALGVYLLLGATYQAGIYFRPNLFPDSSRIDPAYFHQTWFYFANPRIGILALFAHPNWDRLIYLGSDVWLFMIAGATVAIPKTAFVKVYAVSELCMSLPAVFYFVGAYFLRSWPNNPFSRDYQLQTQLAVFVLFSVVPCLFALMVMHDAKLALKLIATFVASVLASPVGLLLTTTFHEIVEPFWKHSHRGEELFNAALIAPLLVFIAGIGWSFKRVPRVSESLPGQENGLR